MSASRTIKVPPTPDEVLDTLRRAAKENTAKIYRRHGADGEIWGVPYAEIRKLEKRIGVSAAVARELWASEVHDARALALQVCEPDALRIRELEGWLKAAASNHILRAHLGGLAGRRTDAAKLARKWIDGKGEAKRAAGWGVIAELAMAGGLDEAWAGELLGRVEAEIHGAFNRERYCMNAALIAIGGTMAAHRKAAAAAAKRIGPVEVDHGDTECKTPVAGPYMKKMWDRRAAQAKKKAAKSKKVAARKCR